MSHSAAEPVDGTRRMQAMIAPAGAAPATASLNFRTAVIFLLQIVACSVVAWGLQVASGAYHAEMAAYPDEPSHAVTGIMLDRYITQPDIWRSPVPFVENYYLHYPKVAIGHWPPLLYIVQAVAAILFGPTRITLLLLQAVLAGLLAATVFRLLLKETDMVAAAIGACSLLAIRVVQVHTSMVMAEILLTLTMWLATLAFARFAATEAWRDSILFGLWTSAAILTKGTGWALGIVPVVVILLTRRWRLVKRPAFWFACVVIAVLSLPWQIATTHMAAAGWDSDTPNLDYAWRAGLQLAAMLFTVPGILLTALAMAGVWFKIVLPWKSKSVEPLAAALAGLVVADWLFHVAVPAGAEARKMIIAVPPLFVLAAYGSTGISHLLVVSRKLPVMRRSLAASAVFSGVCIIGLTTSLPVTQKPEYGYIKAAHSLVEMMPRDTAVLVSSDAYGEGALTSELTLLNPDPERYVVRGSKVLSISEWNGRNRQALVSGEEDCKRILASIPVGFIVMDLRAEVNNSDHQLLRSYLANHPADWRLTGKFLPENGGNPGVEVYKYAANVRPVRHLVINLQHTIGRDLSFR